jgi:putative transposase
VASGRNCFTPSPGGTRGASENDRFDPCQSAPFGFGRKRGGAKSRNRALAWRKNTKVHAIGDAKGRLLSILLTGGEAHDCPAGTVLVETTKPADEMLGDKAYDSAGFRGEIKARGTRPNIPNNSNRKKKFRFSKLRYRKRHLIENAFCRLKDFRRIATRYDKLAVNFAASVYLVAAIVWCAK